MDPDPQPGELADDTDELDWDIARDGRMRDHATVTTDAEPTTVPLDAVMGAQLGLPAALAARGLTVEVVPGWETRSAGSFNPKGAVCHWTAGPRGSTKRPSLSICTTGRSDLPGPLCNVYLDRNGVAVVVAAGRANHAGAGSWRGVTGNSSFFGTECEAAGSDDFTPAQRAAYPRVNAAFCDLGGFGPEMVCGHSEYATPRGRKSDINGYTMDDMRADVASVLAGRPTTSPLQEDDMYDATARYEVLTRLDVDIIPLLRRLVEDSGFPFKGYRNSPDMQEAPGVVGDGSIVLAAPGFWFPVPTPSHWALYQARGLVGNYRDIPPNEFRAFRELYLAPQSGKVDSGELAAALRDLVPAAEAAATAEQITAQAKAVADELDARARERLKVAGV